MSTLGWTGLMAMGLLACGSTSTSPSRTAPAPIDNRGGTVVAARTCPADLSANACRRYQYFLGGTDALFNGLPADDATTEADDRRVAASGLDAAQCRAALDALTAWGAAHLADLHAITAGDSLPADEQPILRYGADKSRFEIDAAGFAMTDVDNICTGARDVLKNVGLSSDFGWLAGVLDISDAYTSPN